MSGYSGIADPVSQINHSLVGDMGHLSFVDNLLREMSLAVSNTEYLLIA